MNKVIIVPALLVAGVLGVGYPVGQIGGVTTSSAASAVVTPVATQTAPDGGHQDGGGAQDAPHADGTVTAINGDALTISAGTDPSGTSELTGVTTVTLTSATQYEAGHDSTGTISKSSITVGSYVIVDGTLSSDGKAMTATSLGINPEGLVAGR